MVRHRLNSGDTHQIPWGQLSAIELQTLGVDDHIFGKICLTPFFLEQFVKRN